MPEVSQYRHVKLNFVSARFASTDISHLYDNFVIFCQQLYSTVAPHATIGETNSSSYVISKNLCVII
jgi:hypothetical protein